MGIYNIGKTVGSVYLKLQQLCNIYTWIKTSFIT